MVRPSTKSIAGKRRVAEHLQPVRVRLAREKVGGALAGALGAVAAVEAAVVEEELEQGQVVGAEVRRRVK